jgi:hypothetical protein
LLPAVQTLGLADCPLLVARDDTHHLSARRGALPWK